MDIFDRRKLDLFKLVRDCRFGTLWWVANSLWARNRKLRLKNLLKKHPGVAIARTGSGEYAGVVPMLFGTSKRHTGALVVDMQTDSGKLTYFLKLKPVEMTVDDFFGDVIEPAAPKPRLSRDEIADLNKFLGDKL